MDASRRLLTVLATLEDLSDDELQAVSARALCLLLDRPVDPAGSLLDVEVVAHEESRLLGGYRALAPRAQRRLREQVRHLQARARAALRGHVLLHPRPRTPDTRRPLAADRPCRGQRIRTTSTRTAGHTSPSSARHRAVQKGR